MPEHIFMELSMYIMVPEPISVVYFTNPSHQFLCLYACPLIVARERLGNDVTAATDSYATWKNCRTHRSLYGSCRQRKAGD